MNINYPNSTVGYISDLAQLVQKRSRKLMLKRLFDLSVSLVVLLILFPLLVILGILIKIDSPGGIFYNQDRIGLNGKLFRLYKFRTMYSNRSGVILGKEVRPGDDRVTRVGFWLRRFKIDELPQLINIISGQMSIIGPRPDIPVQVESYNDFQRQRLLMPPGLSGLAQVSGNVWMTWPERIKLDVWYIQNWSIWLDLKIIWYTISVIVFGEQPAQDPFGLKNIL